VNLGVDVVGSRIGYCVRKANKRSQIFRKQWKQSISFVVQNMWDLLSLKKKELGGMQAIRDDLGIERAFAALVVSAYTPPFDSIEEDTGCDITDNGLITIDISDYKDWKIYHSDVDFYGELVNETLIAKISVNGFRWLVSQKELSSLGEGLD